MSGYRRAEPPILCAEQNPVLPALQFPWQAHDFAQLSLAGAAIAL